MFKKFHLSPSPPKIVMAQMLFSGDHPIIPIFHAGFSEMFSYN